MGLSPDANTTLYFCEACAHKFKITSATVTVPYPKSETKMTTQAVTTVSKIYKFSLEQPHVNKPELVKIPQGGVIRKMTFLDARPRLWVEFDTLKEFDYEDRYFQVFGTGALIPAYLRYIGTYFEITVHSANPFVWHVYEMPAPTE